LNEAGASIPMMSRTVGVMSMMSTNWVQQTMLFDFSGPGNDDERSLDTAAIRPRNHPDLPVALDCYSDKQLLARKT